MLPQKRSFEDHVVDTFMLALTDRVSTKLDLSPVLTELAAKEESRRR